MVFRATDDREGDAALVVLGCVVRRARAGGSELAEGAARRRVHAAAEAWHRDRFAIAIASGGRRWDAGVEADAIARELARLGVPEDRIVRERASHTTRDNARYVAALCARIGVTRVAIVTCDWHMDRAASLVAREGLEVIARVVAASPAPSVMERLWRWGREKVLAGFVVAGVAGVIGGGAIGCKTSGNGASGNDAGASAVSASIEPNAFARAEDRRRSKDVIALLALHEADPNARRDAARALARIGDADAVDGLLRALDDEDATTTAWGAYGLGRACKGNEARFVKALAARAASFDVAQGEEQASRDAGSRGARDAIDPRGAIARAIGRCGGADAEGALTPLVKRRDGWAEPAALALGDLAAHGGINEGSMTALIEASFGGGDAALYPFARMDRVSDAFATRVAKAALAQIDRAGKPGMARSFAVRALGRTGSQAVGDLARVVRDRAMTANERADAARAFKGLGDEGRAAALDALVQLAPSHDAFAITRLAEDDFEVLRALVTSIDGGDVGKKSEPSLFAIASLDAPGNPPPSLARRIAELRCAAAQALSKGAYDSDVLAKCDASGGEIGDRAKLAALVKRPLGGERRSAWRALAKSAHARVREEALEAIDDHPELGDAARAALADALADNESGIVATAADVLHAHPDRALVLADSEKRAALDPGAPPPSAKPAKSIDPRVAASLAIAMKRPWPEDRVETRVALLEASSALQADGARAFADAACRDPNVTMRDHAARALRVLGVTNAACPSPDLSPDADAGSLAAAPEIDHPLARATRVVFATDAGDLAIAFDPALTPVAAARFVAFARAHFYDGIVVHRMVPGFVVQFGDPDGDGYGGAGHLLRCETAPVPFEALDVGVALAGKDTGSSQIFVSLARWPHLDGEYARVGRAEGDWARVAEGDVIRSARVEE